MQQGGEALDCPGADCYISNPDGQFVLLPGLFLCVSLLGNMNVRINQVYLVGIHIPSVINAPSPLKEVAASTHVVDAVRKADAGVGARNVTSMKRHFCIILHYEPSTHVGTLLLGTTNPTQPHRFVPCAGTTMKDYQSPCWINLSDGSQLRLGRYYNFSHALRATLIFPGDTLDEQAVPPPAFCKDTFGGSGDVIEAFVNEKEVQVLKNLHEDYWNGVRYARDGTPIVGTSGEPRPESGGGSGIGGAEGPWTSEASGSGPGTSGGQGFGPRTPGGPGFGDTGTRSGTRRGSSRPINNDGTIDVPLSIVSGVDLHDSACERLSRALEEEEERLYQMELMENDCKFVSPPEVFCFLTPWRVQAAGAFDVL